jgi:hypothetical protein
VSIVLKPLDAALRDGDRIYGSVLGSAINSTGSLQPVSAPVASAQQAAMEAAFRQTGRSPRDVDFLELHATGTAKGDPTEANWVGPWFKRDGETLVGSVKGNIGQVSFRASPEYVLIKLQAPRDHGLSRFAQQGPFDLRDWPHSTDCQPQGTEPCDQMGRVPAARADGNHTSAEA